MEAHKTFDQWQHNSLFVPEEVFIFVTNGGLQKRLGLVVDFCQILYNRAVMHVTD